MVHHALPATPGEGACPPSLGRSRATCPPDRSRYRALPKSTRGLRVRAARETQTLPGTIPKARTHAQILLSGQRAALPLAESVAEKWIGPPDAILSRRACVAGG